MSDGIMYQLTRGSMVINASTGIMFDPVSKSGEAERYKMWINGGGIPTTPPSLFYYGKIGTGEQSHNTVKPDGNGWVQMQYERPDNSSIAYQDGTWGVVVLTTAEKLSALTAVYNSDVSLLKEKMTAALLTDGAIMETTYSQIRTSFASRKAQYLADKAVILAGG